MGIIKGFTFDGVNSLDYNIGITGSAVYNAPTRNVEMISIPGRDGEYALDHGRFNNIEITYPSGMGDNDQTNFAQRVSDLRNQLASRVGYKRLEDEYNPDEYRMAIYKSGLEVSPVQYSRAGQFDIIFDCKPQRFLKSGETATSKARNSTINNPTLFDAHPLLQFTASGSGGINLGSKKLEFFNSPLGTINLPFTVSTSENTTDTTDTIEFSGSYNAGDMFRVKGSKASFNLTASSTISSVEFPSGMDLRANPRESSKNGNNAITTVEDWQETEFTIGTASTVNKTYTPSYVFGGSSHTATFTLSLVYDGDATLLMVWTATLPSGMTLNRITTNSKYTLVCDSTVNSLTGDLYIDLDNGEAYRVQNGVYSSINNYVNLGGELPTLPPGNTTITYSTSISNFKITPRWYKI